LNFLSSKIIKISGEPMKRDFQSKRPAKVHFIRMLRVVVGVASLTLCSCGGEGGAAQGSGTASDSGRDSGGIDASGTNDASRDADATSTPDMRLSTDLGGEVDVSQVADAGGSDLGQDATSSGQERYAPDNGRLTKTGRLSRSTPKQKSLLLSPMLHLEMSLLCGRAPTRSNKSSEYKIVDEQRPVFSCEPKTLTV
jgi:hypothetical protein